MAKIGRTVQAVDRTLAIMDHMARFGRPVTLTEISKSVGLNISTTHRLLYTLIAQGYAEQDFITGRYRLGCKSIQVGQSALYSLDLRRAAVPWLKRLEDKLERSLYLSVRNGDEILVIYRSSHEGEANIIPDVGVPMSIESTVPGQLFIKLQKATNSEPWNMRIHEVGQRMGSGELSVPVFDHTLRAVGVLTIISTHNEDICKYLPSLQETAWEISRQLGVEGIPGIRVLS